MIAISDMHRYHAQYVYLDLGETDSFLPYKPFHINI